MKKIISAPAPAKKARLLNTAGTGTYELWYMIGELHPPVTNLHGLFVDKVEVNRVDVQRPNKHPSILLGDHRLVKNYPENGRTAYQKL